MFYSIGRPGQPWGALEKAQWLSQQTIKRDYQDEVVSKLIPTPDKFERHMYGVLNYANKQYPLFGYTSSTRKSDNPTVLITGGVHGYETSGVQGAIEFLTMHAQALSEGFNFVVVPCVSPWGYETINRWNPHAIDPNRSFMPQSEAPESRLLMIFLDALGIDIDVHFDLHETTDTDDSEFRPALAARDGKKYSVGGIPDGFYTVADSSRPELAFQRAVIDAVKQVTHIAPADNNNQIIGADVVSEGVIYYDKKALYLCGGVTDAQYVTTTEVYPDSKSATPEQCIQAQVAAILGGLNYISKRSL